MEKYKKDLDEWESAGSPDTFIQWWAHKNSCELRDVPADLYTFLISCVSKIAENPHLALMR